MPKKQKAGGSFILDVYHRVCLGFSATYNPKTEF